MLRSIWGVMASMRPRHRAAENDDLMGMAGMLGNRFNEAAA